MILVATRAFADGMGGGQTGPPDGTFLRWGNTNYRTILTPPNPGNCLGITGGGIGGISCGGGSSSPGGVANSIQYNNGGDFGGVLLSLNQVLMGSVSMPQAVSIPGCSGSTSGVTYNSSTQAFGCNTFGALSLLGAGTGLVVSGSNLNVNIAGGGPTTHQFATALSATGVLSLARPLCADLSDASTGCATAVGALATLGAGTGLSISGGNLIITATGVGAGSCSSCNLTYNAQGQITVAANGTGSVPNGSVNQIVGYSATNTGEAQTIGGDATYARTGANAGSLTVTKSSGNLFTSSTFGASLNLSTLMSGDCTIASGGAITCTKSSGNLFTSATFGAALNLSALLSQDCTISSGGVMTCTKAGNGTGPFTAGAISGTSYSTTGTGPAVSGCGSGAAVGTNSTDNGGNVVIGSTSPTTACTITWHGTYTKAPDCVLADRGPTYQSTIITAISSTAMTFNAQISMTGDTVGWVCFFHG